MAGAAAPAQLICIFSEKLHLFFLADDGKIEGMDNKFVRNLFGVIRAVLWSFIGLGGRRADAEGRTAQAGILHIVAVALFFVVLLVLSLIGVVHLVVAR